MTLGEHTKEVKIKKGDERLDRRSGTGHRHSGPGFPDGLRKGGVHGWGVPGEEEMRPVVEVLDKNDPNYDPNVKPEALLGLLFGFVCMQVCPQNH